LINFTCLVKTDNYKFIKPQLCNPFTSNEKNNKNMHQTI